MIVADANIDGLLHLATLTLGITAVYIGLDRLDHDPLKFYDDIRKISVEIDRLMLQYDIRTQDGIGIKELYQYSPVYILCFIADQPMRLGWYRPLHFVQRQRYVPIFNYFRRRYDSAIVLGMCVLSLFIFLILVADETWEWYTPWSDVVLFYFSLSFVLLWILVSVAVSVPLRHARLKQTCGVLQAKVEGRVKTIYADVKAVVDRDEQRPPTSLTASTSPQS